jgi:hypothetical protein
MGMLKVAHLVTTCTQSSLVFSPSQPIQPRSIRLASRLQDLKYATSGFLQGFFEIQFCFSVNNGKRYIFFSNCVVMSDMDVLAQAVDGLRLRKNKGTPTPNATKAKPRPLLKQLISEPQPLVMCYPKTHRPQYTLAFDSDKSAVLASETTESLCARCTVDESATTKIRVVLRGKTDKGNVVTIELQHAECPGQNREYLADMVVGKVNMSERVIRISED